MSDDSVREQIAKALTRKYMFKARWYPDSLMGDIAGDIETALRAAGWHVATSTYNTDTGMTIEGAHALALDAGLRALRSERDDEKGGEQDEKGGSGGRG